MGKIFYVVPLYKYVSAIFRNITPTLSDELLQVILTTGNGTAQVCGNSNDIKIILTGFQSTVISSSIWGQLPFALPCSFLSFREYHFFSPLRILSNGIATFPRNSTLWSLSSSYTVTSRTELISFTLLPNINHIISSNPS